MKAILTKYQGPTNYKGARIVAIEPDGKRVTIQYPYGLNPAEAHQAAAVELCKKLGWGGKLVTGALKHDYVHVFM
jgi:hypothetical protein